MDRIGRVGDQHHVARRGDRLGHVGEAFLRAERRDDLRLGIELHAEPARVIAGLRAPQPGDALRGGIAVGARLADRLDQLVEHVLGRRQIRIAHAEIDDVGAGGAGLGLELVDLLEDVRRQAPHPVEVAHRSKWPLVGSRAAARRRRQALLASRGLKRGKPGAMALLLGGRGRRLSAFFSPLPVRRSPWRPADRLAEARRACFWTASRSPLSALRSVSFNAGRAGSGGGWNTGMKSRSPVGRDF